MPLTPRLIEDFKLPDKADPTELIRTRFLCEGGGFLLCGYTGIGKSSLIAQFSTMWAIKRGTLGFEPTRALRSLIIQAENDDGDIAEEREGVLDSIGMPLDEFRKNSAGVYVCMAEGGERGSQLIGEIKPHMTLLQPQILWLDPVLAFHGGDSGKAVDVGRFLRHELNPLLRTHKAIGGLIIHMNKPTKDVNGKRAMHDFYELLYAATGSMEWANWARAIIVVMPDGEIVPGKPREFRMTVPKRGTRLGWADYAGDLTTTRLLQHGEDGIVWQLRGEAPAPDLAIETANFLPADGSCFSFGEWLMASKQPKTSFNRMRRICIQSKLVIETPHGYHRASCNGAAGAKP